MKSIYFLIVMLVVSACGDRGKVPPPDHTAGIASGITDSFPAPSDPTRTGLVLIATDIVTEVIIRPDPEGDPWEIEKVAGYKGDAMINAIFDRIYAGTLTAYEYHTGEPLTPGDVKKIEEEFNNDRSKIGKLSFTEDWYYDPATNSIEKVTKSIVFGFELYNQERRVYAYRAAFKAALGNPFSAAPGNNP